jgi:hypothetical protein
MDMGYLGSWWICVMSSAYARFPHRSVNARQSADSRPKVKNDMMVATQVEQAAQMSDVTILSIDLIVSDPNVRSGRPIIAGTTLRVQDVVAGYV